MAQHMEGSEDVCPLDHLPQRTALQHFGAENISGLLRQEAHVDQNLKDRESVWLTARTLDTDHPLCGTRPL